MGERFRQFLPLIVVVSVLYFGYVLLGAEYSGYGVKAAARLACNAAMKDQFYRGATHSKWESQFRSRVRGHGAVMDESDYLFEVSDPCNKKNCSCTFDIDYYIETDWPIFTDILQVAEPYRRDFHNEGEVKILNSY